MQEIEQKIQTIAEIAATVQRWRTSGERGNRGDRIVFTNGCFDVLHKGHIELLHAASLLGDRLIVGLNSDASIRKIKGDTRPVHDLSSRSWVLAAIGCVDAVVVFEDDTPAALIAKILPDVLAKGGDYHIADIVGAELVQARGGVVQTIPLVAGYSTTKTIERVLNKKNSKQT